jgi:hypothetical protein
MREIGKRERRKMPRWKSKGITRKRGTGKRCGDGLAVSGKGGT